MPFEIAGRKIGPGYPTWISAEAGINHQGNIGVMRSLIVAAEQAGCDSIKTQKRTVDVVYSAEELAQVRKGPWGETNSDLKRLLEFSPEDCRLIRDMAGNHGLPWSASPWDLASVAVLADLGVEWIKVASASITDLELVGECASIGVPVVMSTGLSTTAEIDAAVEVLEARAPSYALLHTCSAYPSNIPDLHLNRIAWLRERYPGAGAVGYSGHESGVLPTVEAVRLGASIVERHITLDRTMWGSDQAASLEPTGLRVLVRAIRELERLREEGMAAQRHGYTWDGFDEHTASDCVLMAEIVEATRKQSRNRAIARESRGESGPRSVLAVEEAVRKKLRRVGA